MNYIQLWELVTRCHRKLVLNGDCVVQKRDQMPSSKLVLNGDSVVQKGEVAKLYYELLFSREFRFVLEKI